MKKLTLKQALTWCRDLWKWMEKEGKTKDSDKGDWPGWGNKRKVETTCPCCQYNEEHIEKCSNCILINLWVDHIRYIRDDCPCCDITSPFNSFWMEKGIPEDARKIWQECERLLKEIDNVN